MTTTINSQDAVKELRELLEDPRYDYRQAANLWDAWDELSDEGKSRVAHLRTILFNRA